MPNNLNRTALIRLEQAMIKESGEHTRLTDRECKYRASKTSGSVAWLTSKKRVRGHGAS